MSHLYEHRNFMVFNTSELNSIDFSQVLETSIDTVRKSIDDKVREGKLQIHKTIGEYAGFKTKSEWEMNDREGVICNYEKI